ncbi:hypothetical protein ANMWB30_24730 [Arthrobacter sp. MWB30]|nr:hypothetical protein ANMWB30_24730 [Arthrobacter sp. MWB30]
MTPAERLAQIATCPYLARNLGLLPPEELQATLTAEEKELNK